MSFFKIAIYLAICMIVFNLVIGYVSSLGVFPVETIPGTGVVEESDALSVFTGLKGDVADLWLKVTTVFAIPAIGLAILTRSWIPVGLYGFSVVFWTAYTKSNSILSVGGHVPSDFLGIFFIVMMFIYLAATISILTGVD